MSSPAHSSHCPHSFESPTFRKENTFSFCSIKRKLGSTDELFGVPFGLRYLEGWPPTHHTNNNQFSRGASVTYGGDAIRVLLDEEDMIVDHEGLFEVNMEKPWADGELEDKLFPPGADGFITSPADVDPRPPIKLKDTEVSPEHHAAFEDLCEEFTDVFSQDSGDLGKTPLMRMEIPTGDNPPISQRPYGLALKHVQLVQDEIETLERAGVITKSVSPWVSPIVIVPKKTSHQHTFRH